MRSSDPLRLVVFDMDGTLIDSQHHIIASMTRSFESNGFAAPDPAVVRAGVGLPLEAIIGSLLPDISPEQCARLVQDYRGDHRARLDLGDRHEPLMPGAEEVVERLDAAGYLVALATGKGTSGRPSCVRGAWTDRSFRQHSDLGHGTGKTTSGHADPGNE